MKSLSKTNLRWFIILSGLTVLVYLTGLNSILVEALFSKGTYFITSICQRMVSGLLPFALGDFLYIALVIYMISAIYLFGKKLINRELEQPDRFNIPLKIINFFLFIVLLFNLLWGLNYSRPSVAIQLDIPNKKYNTAELVLLGEYFIDQVNELQETKRTRYTIAELEEKAKAAYDKAYRTQPFFDYPYPALKPVLNSWVVTKLGIEGYYNPLSGEANVNMRLPAFNLPFVACHEISHQLGIGREDEANLIGYLTAIHSDDPVFRYSAAYNMLRSILFEIRIKSPEDYKRLYATINPSSLQDFKTERAFWLQYNSAMYGYMGVALDGFLKLNKQRKGTDSYQDIVIWLYNLHKKELIRRAGLKTLQP